ncbi:MAG: hypothetical protein IPP56_13455, partial [Bacteroidetes bacterium]|nr:hypothetical protein [Bacteroidota bacterium]
MAENKEDIIWDKPQGNDEVVWDVAEKKNSVPSVTATNGSLSESVNGGLGGIEQIAPKKDNYVTLSGQKKPLDALNSIAFNQPKELLEEDFTISKRKAKEREPLKQAYIKVQQTPDRNTHYELANELLKIGDYGRAIDAYDKAAALPSTPNETLSQDQAFNQQVASGDDNLAYGIGLSYDKLGKKEDAARMYKVALEKNPDNVEAQKALAYDAYKSGDKEASKKYIQAAHEAENKLIPAQPERVGESDYELDKAKQANLIVQAAEGIILGNDAAMSLISPIAFGRNFIESGVEGVKEAAKDIGRAIELSQKFGDVEAAKLAPAKLISGGIKLGFAAMKIANPAEFAAWETGMAAGEAVLPESMVKLIMQPATTIVGGANDTELKKTVNESLDVFGNLLLFHKLTGAANKFKRNEPLTPKETQEVTEVLQNVKPKEIEKAVVATQEKQALEVKKTELSDEIELAQKTLSDLPEPQTPIDRAENAVLTEKLQETIKKSEQELTDLVRGQIDEAMNPKVEKDGNINLEQQVESTPPVKVEGVGDGAEVEAKKADIERRRQEELNRDENIEMLYPIQTEEYLTKEDKERIDRNEQDKKQREENRNKVNAKYDAELKALEQKQSTETKVEASNTS